MGFFLELLLGDPDHHADTPGPPPRGLLHRNPLAHYAWVHTRGAAAASQIELRNFREGIAPDLEHEIRMARTRWLERNGARSSFPCGIAAADADGSEPPAPDAWGERPVATVPVTVAVTDDAFVFLREGVPDIEPERIVEVGRFPRAAFVSAHLEDARGNRVAAPITDTFEPAAPCRLVVTWRREDGTEDRDVFGFMSLSVAEEAAARFRRSASVT
ncbi:MAG TPA: hypothetical protein VLA82_09745 [Actinomycetota bacterium]|nr:hypothetical protein [Actinomycetota bacterium]